jgi:hypothetical protein
MKRLLLSTALIGLAFAGTAYAGPIAAGSELNIIGGASFTSTQVLSQTPAGLAPNQTGSFAPFIACLSCVTVNQPAFTYSPTVGTGLLFTITEGPLVATITVDAGGSFTPAPNSLAINAPATLNMTGFTATPGTFVWTINQLGQEVGSFSATAEALATPEPAGLALLGVGLLGLGFTQLRRKGG